MCVQLIDKQLLIILLFVKFEQDKNKRQTERLLGLALGKINGKRVCILLMIPRYPGKGDWRIAI